MSDRQPTDNLDREKLLINDAERQTRRGDNVASGEMHQEQLGEYTLLGVLARGGMGTVYRARHETLGREVALKVITGIPSPEEISRFRREIRCSGQLPPHPNIVFVTDAREIAGLLVLIMELVDGIDLRELIRQTGPLTGQESSAIICQAAAREVRGRPRIGEVCAENAFHSAFHSTTTDQSWQWRPMKLHCR